MALTARRRFPAPWRVVDTPGGWKVIDANGLAVAYIYGEDRGRGVSDQGMTKEEARRIAVNVAKLPGLLARVRDAAGRRSSDRVPSRGVGALLPGGLDRRIRRPSRAG